MASNQQTNPKKDISQSYIYKVIAARYGNNIQKLIEYAKTIEDRKQRNAAAKEIIEAMKIINKEVTDVEDYENILWNHLAILSKYELDVDYPVEIIDITRYEEKPQPIEYPKYEKKMPHYGQFIEKFIDEAAKISDEKIRKKYIELVILKMKKNFMFFAKSGNYVIDDQIIEDFKKLANGKVELPEKVNMPHVRELLDKMPITPNDDKRIPSMAEKLQQQKQ